MSSQVAGAVQQTIHRNLHSCDNCRKEKKKCIFSLPWNPEEQSPPCDRCERKNRICAGPVYIPRKSKSAVNPTVAVDEEDMRGEIRLLATRTEEPKQRNPSSSPPPTGRRRVLQPWVPPCAVSSEDDTPDRKEVLKELGDILASRELLRLYLYICEDVCTWLPECTKVYKVKSNLLLVKSLLETEFLRLAKHAYADQEMKDHHDADLRSLIERFETPPQRTEKSTFGNATAPDSLSFLAQVRNESFAKRRRDGVYSVADHLCHDVCTTMNPGSVPCCFSLDLQRLLPTAARSIAKVIGKINLPRDDDFILPVSNTVLAGSSISNAQPFPLSHLTLLQTDENILRRYVQKDPDLKQLFEIDLVGSTVSHLAAHLGRTSNLGLAFHDYSDKSIMSRVKRDIFDLYPHMIAGCRNDVSALDFFVKHGANLNAINKFNQTCLDLASQMGSADVVDWLLQKGHGTCSYGNPIYRAVEFRQITVLEVFIRYYTDHDHHNYQDIIDAAELAETWSAPGNIDEVRWRVIATALRELESNRPSYRAILSGGLNNVEYQDPLDMSFIMSTPSQGTPYAYANSQLSQATPLPDFYDSIFTPQLYGPSGLSQQPGYG